MMNRAPWQNPATTAALVLAATIAGGGWIWRCFTLFPVRGWNEIRLIGAFMWAHGTTPYAAPDGGPVTTWIYGPIPLFFHLPATLANSAAGALLISGGINIALTLATVAIVCFKWPTPAPRTSAGAGRLIAFLISIALWPASSFEFLQADNVGISLALLSLLSLATPTPTPLGRWLAAATCAAALACKQTFIGVAVGEIAFLVIRSDWGTALRHMAKVVGFTGFFYGFAAICFGPSGFIDSVITLPLHQPWVDSFWRRIAESGPQLCVHLLVAMFVLGLALRRNEFRHESLWWLLALVWVCCWPFDLAPLFKDGGSINALHALPLLLPPAMVLVLESRTPRWALATALAAFVIFSVRLIVIRPFSMSLHLEHLRQGEHLARTLPEEVYFPWHPVIAYYGEKRFDHSEDGLYIRFLAKRPVEGIRLRRHLPPKMHVLAFLKNELDWHLVRRLAPPSAVRTDFLAWTIYSWDPRPPEGPLLPNATAPAR